MRLTSTGLALALSVVFAVQARAANIYSEDFDPHADGLNGWSGDSPTHPTSGGVGDSAYLRTTRVGFSPQHRPDAAQPLGLAFLNLRGDLESLYGTKFTISYYGKIFSSPSGVTLTELRHTVRNNVTNSPNNASWSYVIDTGNATTLGAAYSDWTLIEMEVDTTWTNAEAVAHGWRLDIAGLDFSDVWLNVTSHEFFTGTGNGGTKTFGIDNVLVQSVEIPEPAALTLAGLALIGLMVVSRRGRRGGCR